MGTTGGTVKLNPYARIIIEGMDGSGKTTLLNHLSDFLGDRVEYVPGYNRQPEPKPPMERWWLEQLGRGRLTTPVVHDRFFYPEFVYGPILRGHVNMQESTRDYVLKFLRTHAFLIYCRPPYEVLREGVDVEMQMPGVKEMFDDLLAAYDKLMVDEAKHYLWRFMLYDWTDDKAMAKLAQRITGYIYQ